MIFSSEPDKVDQDQEVGWSSLKTSNEGPGVKSQKKKKEKKKKKSILRISKAGFGPTKVLFYSFKSQNFYGFILRSPWFCKGKFNRFLLECLRSHDADANYSIQAQSYLEPS